MATKKKPAKKKKPRSAAQKAATAKMLRAAKAARNKNPGRKTAKKKKTAPKKRVQVERTRTNRGATKKKTRRNSADYPLVTESSDWIPATGVRFNKKANGEIQVLLKQD